MKATQCNQFNSFTTTQQQDAGLMLSHFYCNQNAKVLLTQYYETKFIRWIFGMCNQNCLGLKCSNLEDFTIIRFSAVA